MKRLLLILCIVLVSASTSKAQMIAVGTNALSDVLMMPSLNVELVIGNRTSFGVEGMMGSKLLGNQAKVLAVAPEYRYYFSGRPMSKWFMGLGVLVADYDIHWANKVYEGFSAGGGFTYGYVFNLTPRLNIDVHAGFGVQMYSQKEYFEQDNFETDWNDNGVVKPNASGYWLFPPRFGVSITYILK